MLTRASQRVCLGAASLAAYGLAAVPTRLALVSSCVCLAACLSAGCGGSSRDGPQSVPPASLIGVWSGGAAQAPASLQLTTVGGSLSLNCESDTLTGPLSADAQGNFDVTATRARAMPVSIPGQTLPTIHLVGRVSGGTMTIQQVSSGGTGLTYTLTYGQKAPTFSGPCPI